MAERPIPESALVPLDLGALWRDIAEHGPRLKQEDLALDVSTLIDERRRRDDFVRRFAWAIPAPFVIAQIAAFLGDRLTLEVGAGSGLWARLLAEAGVELQACDDASFVHWLPVQYFFPIDRLDAVEAVHGIEPEALFVCWPSYKEPWATNALSAFRGDTVVYVGEGPGGCTADDAFHALLADLWVLRDELVIPQWKGIHDRVYLYRHG